MMLPEVHRRGGLRPGHFMLMTGVAVVGGIVAVALFFIVVGWLFHLIEIAAVILVIVAILRWIVLRALK